MSPIRIVAIWTSLAAALLLSACGGGGDSSSSSNSTFNGSIYVNTFNGRAGMTTDAASQAEADTLASNACYTPTDGSKCTRLLTFGTGMCGAVARGSTYNPATYQYGYTFSAESSSAAETAKANALAGCQKSGAVSCAVVSSRCNSNGK
jgi:predicted choloylglycine hydrolase